MQLGPIGGTVYVKVGGRSLPVAGTFKFKPAEVVREGKVGLSGPAGYTEKPVFQEVTCEIFLTAEVDLLTINRIKNETLVFELANGQSYTLRNAFQSGEIDADGGEGTTSVTFQGKMELS